MTFLVSDKQSERHERIRAFLEADSAIRDPYKRLHSNTIVTRFTRRVGRTEADGTSHA